MCVWVIGDASWGPGKDEFRRMLPNIHLGKTLWENPSGKPKIKTSFYMSEEGCDQESLGGVPGGECVPAAGRLRGKREWA